MSLRRSPQCDSSTVKVGHLRSLNNLSGIEFRFATYSATGLIIASSTDKVAGVIANGGNASAVNVTLHVGGKSQITAGEAVSAGETLISDASGYGIASVADNGWIGAIALQDASAAGQVIWCDVKAGMRY